MYRFPARDSSGLCSPADTSILERFLRRPWDGKAIAEMWQLWIHRRIPAPLGSTDWALLVRPEIAPYFGLHGTVEP